MNGLPVAFYTYQGTQTGDRDPWNRPEPVKRAYTRHEPKPPKTPRPPHDPGPCGTYKKYRWHYRRGEKCEPCEQAKRDYDRTRYHNREREPKPVPKPKSRTQPTLEQKEQTKARQRRNHLRRYADPEWLARKKEYDREWYQRAKAEGKR